MPRPSKTDQELGFADSFWRECRTLQADHAAAVSMFAYPTDRPGVWRYRIVFTPLTGQEENLLGGSSVTFDWPNGNNQSLAGAFWHYSRQLTRTVTDSLPATKPRPKQKG